MKTVATPLPYDPALEQPAPDEAQTIRDLEEARRSIGEATFANGGHGLRTVHAKSHALLIGTFTVLDGLPAPYAQGLFAKPGRHEAILRISTNPGDILDDAVSVPRGLALKVVGVEGEHLAPDEAPTQDFVMVNGPAFLAPDPAAFAKSLSLLAKTTDRAPGLKKAFSTVARGAEQVIEAVGGESATLKSVGGHPMTNPLGETYYGQTPFRYGEHVAKFSLAPASDALKRLEDAELDVRGRPNGLRDSLIDHFHAQGGVWELRVQLRTNAETMPIEDASVVWPEEDSPFVTVARVEVAPQESWSEARAAAIDDRMSFSVWHALAAHRPLGGINRARRETYAMSKDLRARQNGCPIHEPRAGAVPVR
jgi:catalase